MKKLIFLITIFISNNFVHASTPLPYNDPLSDEIRPQTDNKPTCESVYSPNFRDESPIRQKPESKYAPKQLESGNYDIAGSNGIIIVVDSIRSDAGYNNSFGHYFAYGDGVPIYGTIDFANVKLSQGVGNSSIIEYNQDTIPEGASQVGFFLIPNGGSLNPSLNNGTLVTFEVINEKWTPLIGMNPVKGAGSPAFFSDKKLNPCRVQHMDSFGDGSIGWEDITGGGDRDYNDATLETSIKTLNTD